MTIQHVVVFSAVHSIRAFHVLLTTYQLQLIRRVLVERVSLFISLTVG